MKRWISHVLVFGLGIVATLAWIAWTKPRPTETRWAPAVSSADGVAFGELGLKNGDLLKSVNGITSPEMMGELARGYERGEVCVVFERGGSDREICVKQQRTASAH